ncbi:hypothetical protein APHAL10511_001698 [Amanita phalloides]|nr:hypothetical protein APHAL10511_001698 [Amanita phalloides]
MSSPASNNGTENPSLFVFRPLRQSQATTKQLVKRLRAMVQQLLPVQVSQTEIEEPTSRIITPQVVSAFTAAAGDFVEGLPYALLRARSDFMRDANCNPADYGENISRAIACEVLANVIVHASPRERLAPIMSTRYEYKQEDTDSPDISSALELAIDQNCTIFLSSTEAQDVVNALWRGDLIQKNDTNNDIDYVPYSEVHGGGTWRHFDPARLSVPRYQNIFRIVVWFFFLAVYSQAVQEPIQRLGKPQNELDGWEVVLYVMTLAFTFEDVYRFWRLLQFATWHALNFWSVISLMTQGILFSALLLRIAGIDSDGEQATDLRLESFRVLSCAAPLMWMKLVTVFEGYKYIGTMEICVARMLKESGIFVGLLSVLAVGFYQGLYALDAADGTVEGAPQLINVLVQSLLQSPNYARFAGSPTGLIIYYLWNTVTAVILLNVLISLFSSAYSDVVQNAEAQYLAFFAGKTISMIRAPDSYVYPAPFNLIETIFIAPFETLTMGGDIYARLNRYVMTVIFFIPLSIIALYETARERKRGSWMEHWLAGYENGQEDSPQIRNPSVNDPACPGKEISRVPFEELIKVFPNTYQSIDATILNEINSVKGQLAIIMDKLNHQGKDGFGRM